MPYKDKDKQREFQRKRVAACRAAFFEDKICSHCPSNIRLELHHKDPATKISHNIWSWSSKRREEEIAKCEVLCEECHKVETIKQLSVEWSHGTRDGYATHGCRCIKCRTAQRIYMRQWRHKTAD